MNALIVLGLLALVWAVVLLPPLDPFGDATTAGRRPARARLRPARSSTTPRSGASAGAPAAGPPPSRSPVAPARWWSRRRHLISTATPLPFREPLAIAGLLTSALLLGWSLIAMLLGHWYLVAPRLTFRHLVVFCWVLLGTVVLRLAALGGTLAAAVSVDQLVEPNPWRVLTSVEGQGMFFWFRLAWGLVIPLALAVMSLHCARQRSNQSATGILYVLVVGTFIGEITAYYLAVTTGIPA